MPYKDKEKAKLNKKEWKRNNPERIKESDKKYRSTHKKEGAARMREWRKANHERALLSAKLLRENNRDRFNTYGTKHYYKHREKILAKEKIRMETDVEYAIKRRLRIRLCGVFRSQAKGCKTKSTLTFLGIEMPEFMKYIENLFKPGMTWDNRKLWHLDHIRPCNSFDLTDPEQQKKCFHYTNLQPLWAHDNLSKNKY